MNLSTKPREGGKVGKDARLSEIEREVEEGNPSTQVARNGSGSSGQWEELEGVDDAMMIPLPFRPLGAAGRSVRRSLDLDQCCAV